MIHSSALDSITVQTEQVLIEKYDRLYRLAYSYVYNEDDALDIVQESACKAICQCNSLKDPSKLYSWICRIVVNTTMDLLRSRKKEDLPGELPEQASEDVYQETDLKKCPREPGTSKPYHRRPTVLRRYETGRYCTGCK